MVKAITQVMAGEKLYNKGEDIEGLPSPDEEWLVKNGYAEKQAADTRRKKDKRARSEERDVSGNAESGQG